jgi:hypothetical protein
MSLENQREEYSLLEKKGMYSIKYGKVQQQQKRPLVNRRNREDRV